MCFVHHRWPPMLLGVICTMLPIMIESPNSPNKWQSKSPENPFPRGCRHAGLGVIFPPVACGVQGNDRGILLSLTCRLSLKYLRVSQMSMLPRTRSRIASRGVTGVGGGGSIAPLWFFFCLSAQRSVMYVDDDIPVPHYETFSMNFFQVGKYVGVPPPPPLPSPGDFLQGCMAPQHRHISPHLTKHPGAAPAYSAC